MGFGNFLLKVGKAFVKNSAKMLPGGGLVVDVAAAVVEDYKLDQRLNQMRLEMEEGLRAGHDEFRGEMQRVLAELAAGLGQEMRDQLASYLAQLQGSMKQGARYLGDPSGTTVPATANVGKPEDLASFLPQRPARFRPGAHVPGRPSWKLVELLGAGGFGEVWKAVNEHMGEPAAFKFFLDPEACRRFTTHEARVIRQVRQQGRREGIVALLDAEPAGDPPWLEFEYADGGDLCTLLPRWQKLDEPERLRRVHRAVEYLARSAGHFHRLDPPVVHRDLKPSNILLKRGETGKYVPLIADFGIGQILAPDQAAAVPATPAGGEMPTIRAFTPQYASPQQKRGLKPDRRDDVYALAVIWYQLLRGDFTLDRPSGEGWKRVLAKMGVAEPLVGLLNRCWDDEPEERPADAMELADQLGRLLAPAAAVAGPGPVLPPPPARPSLVVAPDGSGDPGEGRQGVAVAKESVENLCQKAQQAIAQGHNDQAKQFYLQALGACTHNPKVHYGLASVCFLLNDLASAAYHFKEVTRLDPLRGCAYINLGAVYNRLDQLDNAITVLRRGIQLDINRAEGYYNLGLVYRRKEQADLAIQAYREATRINPRMAEAHYNLANLYLEKEQFGLAVAHYRQALNQRPSLDRRGLEQAEAALQASEDATAP